VTGNSASGGPLVHIRAIPDGGLAGVSMATNFHRTFYDRYTPRETPHIDRRQPLPSAFAARYIQAGIGAFNTNLQIWREGLSGGQTCADYRKNYFGTAAAIREIVRFDEHENPTTNESEVRVLTQVTHINLPAPSSTATSSGIVLLLSISGDDELDVRRRALRHGIRRADVRQWMFAAARGEKDHRAGAER